MEKGQLIFNLKNIETYDPEDFYIVKVILMFQLY